MKDKNFSIIGLTRVRNESLIIKESLDHLSKFCEGGIFVYDDCSTDDTVSICESHPNVKKIIKGSLWDENRARAEFENRHTLLMEAKKYAKPTDWFVYLDADERIEFDWNFIKNFNDDVIAVRMKLFDFYITADDIDKKYYERKWLGPEFREIIMAFKNSNELCYDHPDQREVTLGKGIIENLGYVRHYGKAISVEEWEKTCDYYGNHFPQYSEKWKRRKGKAVHISVSDFGNNLISWDEKEEKGFLLIPEVTNNLKILISTHHLLDFTGSEIYTLTLAEHLKNYGCEVKVYSRYADKIIVEFEKLGIQVFTHLEEIKNQIFDIAHVHHSINAAEVRHYFPELPIVFASHGILPFLEQPSKLELGISNYIAVSDEVKNNLVSSGIEESAISVIRNLIDEYKFLSNSKNNATPKNVLVISSRIDTSKENAIRQACKLRELNVQFIGGRFGQVNQQELKRMIENVDLVFSLGRGAVESMLMNKAVIIFDYQGGDGMITEDNFEEIMKCNFSGRRFKKNFSVDELIEEINKYDLAQIKRVREIALKYFSANKLISEIVDVYNLAIYEKKQPLSNEQKKLLEYFIKSIQETRNYTTEITNRKNPNPVIEHQSNSQITISELLIENNQLSAAKLILTKAIFENPSNLDALNNLAVIHIMEEDFNDALNCLKQVLVIDLKNEIALGNLQYLQELVADKKKVETKEIIHA